MKKYLTVLASFIIMLCIGSVYVWSIIASELIGKYTISVLQSQVIFGALIAIFPFTMVFVGRLGERMKHRYFGYISGLLFSSGYLLASYSQGNFVLVFIGIGVLAGIGTGFGYWVSLTSSVRWFPQKKGLVTGIAAAGFGLGAVFMSELSEVILLSGKNVLQLLAIFGIGYGLIILVSSNFIYQPPNRSENAGISVRSLNFLHTMTFRKLFSGIFLGTFAGLLIIGSLSIIGGQYHISDHHLVLGVAFFAIANFLGRLIWGYLSDFIGAGLGIFFALLFQSVSIVLLNFIHLTDTSFVVLSILIGFGFGGNFVLFARETAQVFGLNNLGIIYPYVFTGYAIAGIAGPISGGFLYDLTGSFHSAIFLAAFVSLAGGVLFLNQYLADRKG